MKKISLIILMVGALFTQISYAQLGGLIKFASKLQFNKIQQVEKVGMGISRSSSGILRSSAIPSTLNGSSRLIDQYSTPDYHSNPNDQFRSKLGYPPNATDDYFKPSSSPSVTDENARLNALMLNKRTTRGLVGNNPSSAELMAMLNVPRKENRATFKALSIGKIIRQKIAQIYFDDDLKQHTILQKNLLQVLGYYSGKLDGTRDMVLQQAIEKFNQAHPFPLKNNFKLSDKEAFSLVDIQKNLDVYAALFSNLGYSQLEAGVQLPQLKEAIGHFQKAQGLPVSEQLAPKTSEKIEAVFAERARKLQALGKLPAEVQQDDITAITEALLDYGKQQQKEKILDAEAALNEDWKEKIWEIIKLGFDLPIDDLIDLTEAVLDYLKEDKTEAQYPRIEPYLKQERAFVDYILDARDLPCELNLIAQNQYSFRYLDWGTRRLVLRKLAQDWELLELDAEQKNVRKRVRGTVAVHEFELACGLLLAERSTDSVGYIYISPYPTPAQQLRIQLGKETLAFDLKEGKLVGTAVDTVLKAYFLRTRHSVLVQSEALSENSSGEDKIDPKVLAQIQQSLNTWAAEAQQSIHFITCLNERYSNIEDLAKVKTRKDIAVHTGKNLGEKDLKSLQKLLKKLEKAAKKSNETAEPNEASVVVWVGNESREEWALYLDSLALQGALAGKHLVLFAGQVPGTKLLQAVTQGKTGLSTVTVFPEVVSGPVTVSWLKALYTIMETAPTGKEVPLEKLLWQSLELAMVKVPVEKRGSWAGLKYFQVHRLESERR